MIVHVHVDLQVEYMQQYWHCVKWWFTAGTGADLRVCWRCTFAIFAPFFVGFCTRTLQFQVAILLLATFELFLKIWMRFQQLALVLARLRKA